MAKAQYIGVDGVSRKVKSMPFGVDGVDRKVKNGYFGVGGVSRQFLQGLKPISEYDVGSIVKMNVGGVQKDFIVVHQGIPSSLYSATCDGTWLLMKDIYEKKAWDTYTGNNSYLGSTTGVGHYLNNTFITLFDSNIQSIIKQVKIPYCLGVSRNMAVESGENVFRYSKVFLLSVPEIGMGDRAGVIDGAPLSYFNGCSEWSADSKRIANFDGVATQWWTRTPYKTKISGACTASFVSDTGDFRRAEVYSIYGVRPALILPKTTLVNPDTNIVIG